MKKATCWQCKEEVSGPLRFVKCSCTAVIDMDAKMCNTCDFQVGSDCTSSQCSLQMGFNIEPTGWRRRT